jgi:glycosyltransferase involved in cell wall biosynthesis
MPLVKKVEPITEPLEKKTILFLSDHPLAPSGVGVQARMLIEGLLKTGKYRFLCFGGALRHHHYGVGQVTPDFVIKPVDGFGDREAVRKVLMTERPDAVVIFTDPRQFIWLWEAEDEIHQICPIAYWHVWDNDPYPVFNRVWYESTELVNCLSYKTYEMVKPHFSEPEGKVNYIPHAFPKEMYFPLPEKDRDELRRGHFGPRADWFIGLWVNRNAGRKLPSDVMEAWKLFLDKLEKEEGHRKALLVMHTDPEDQEGPNLHMVQELLGLQNNVIFSTNKVEFQQMNLLHNMADCTVNIAKNEGFGLSTLISLQCGKPIVALKTGGMTRQVVDHRDGTELGVAIEPVTRKLVGSQMVPYIYEDFASQEDVANGLMKLYRMTPEEKANFKERALSYVKEEFSYEKMISEWDRTLSETIHEWETKKKFEKKWVLAPLNPVVSSIPAAVEKAPPPRAPTVKTVVRPLQKMDPAILARLSNVKGKK